MGAGDGRGRWRAERQEGLIRSPCRVRGYGLLDLILIMGVPLSQWRYREKVAVALACRNETLESVAHELYRVGTVRGWHLLPGKGRIDVRSTD